jgi:UrcA family protein
MDSRKVACLIAAGFIGLGMVGAATQSTAAPQPDVTIKGKSIAPATQRTVYYGDLNLAFRPAQTVLKSRIRNTASDLCWDLNGFNDLDVCTHGAIRSTDDQVAAAIERAQRKMAGLPVGPAVAISMVLGGR